MLNFRFIVKMLGSVFILETFFMLAAAAVSYVDKGDDLYPILLSCGILLAAGLLFYCIGFRANEYNAGKREGMLIVSLTWALLSFFGMLPFYIGGYLNDAASAYFETMSGLTTTGGTMFADVESLPRGILFWRSLMQWQGGVGVAVFAVALLPIFGGGASQMFDAETTGITHERFRPRITQVAKRLFGVYILLTLMLIGLLWAGPMNFFDSVCQAFATISTGGYSTKNSSVAFWASPYTEYIIMAFMFIGSLNMALLYFCVNGKPKKLLKDEESHWFLVIILGAVLITTVWLLYKGFATDVEVAFRQAGFQIISLMSSTGFATADYVAWGPFFWLLAITVMFIGGCAGSTAGGLKVGRFVILNKILSKQFLKQTHPNAIVPVRMNGAVVSAETMHRIMAFAFVYIALIMAGCLILMGYGVGFEESIGSTVSAISNVGPSLGKIGGFGNYSELPVVCKWTLSFLMMTGRLEVFTVLTILLPGFWKQ